MLRSRKPQEATMPRRAYSYARFSHSRQKDGDSVRRQKDWYEETCRQHGWHPDDTESFTDKGRSARRGKNRAVGELGRFLDLVKRRRITRGSVLVVESLDRLSREEVGDAFDLVRGILKSGITIATRTPERVYEPGSENDMLTILEWLFIAARACEESQIKSMRISEAWETARERARASAAPHQAAPPWWIRRTSAGYDLVPEYAAAMRKALDLLPRYGIGRTCQVLNREKEPCGARSGRWTWSMLHAVIRRRDVVGEFQPHRVVEVAEDGKPPKRKRVPDGPPIPGYYPSLIGEDEWVVIRDAVARRKRGGGRPALQRENLFTGIVWDAVSQRPLSRHGSAAAGGARYDYLQAWDQGPGRTSVRYEAFEHCILDTLAMLRPEDVLDPAQRSDERERRIGELQGRLTALDVRQRQLQADAADPQKDYLGPVLAQVSADLKATATELEALKLESRTSRAEALADCQTLIELRAKARAGETDIDPAELDGRIKAALPSVVQGIWVQPQPIEVPGGKRRTGRYTVTRAQIVHVQIWLKSGVCRYEQLLPPKLHGAEPWSLNPSQGEWDLRRGPYRPRDIGHVAGVAEPA